MDKYVENSHGVQAIMVYAHLQWSMKILNQCYEQSGLTNITKSPISFFYCILFFFL